MLYHYINYSLLLFIISLLYTVSRCNDLVSGVCSLMIENHRPKRSEDTVISKLFENNSLRVDPTMYHENVLLGFVVPSNFDKICEDAVRL